MLKVENLSVFFQERLQAVKEVSFSLDAGRTLAIVGESGSGKTAMAEGLLRLNPKASFSGDVWFQGQNLSTFSEKEMQKIRGQKIGYIFQDPMASLNPTMKVGKQIAEVLIHHKLKTKKEALEIADFMLDSVGISNPKEKMNRFPHELSGGERQRLLIASTLIGEPDLIIADEPTTALDPKRQAQIISLLKTGQKKLQSSLILITHDLELAAAIADEILIFYAGRIVERGAASDLFDHPKHPYTEMLLHAVPKEGQNPKIDLAVIPGSPPSIHDSFSGCPFKERCPHRSRLCDQEPPFSASVACFREEACLLF